MEKQYHILNGDQLRRQFPGQIKGELIITRECFMDGVVKCETLDELFKIRSGFISELYGKYTPDDYYADTVAEFQKIRNIPDHSEINLWFEDDLFCQVNFWFCTYLINHWVSDPRVYLIRPPFHTQYGFGGLTEDELVRAFQEKVPIQEPEKITQLWHFYQNEKTGDLLESAKKLKATFPFIPDAVEAHIERIPGKNGPGRPIMALVKIQEDLGTNEFAPVFREFCKRESIYGYGDLQVKRLLEEIRKGGI